MTVRIRIGAGLFIAAIAAFVVASCSDETAGPSHPLEAHFSVAPVFSSADAAIITIAQIRFTLNRTEDGTLARDTVINIPAGSDSVSLSLTVPVFTQGQTFALRIALITPTGDTAFRGGPVTVSPTTNGTPPMVPITLVYAGIGSNAARVVIATKDTSTFFGQSVLLTATALDSAGRPISGTPVAWSSLDLLQATVPVPDTGRVVGGSARGVARIVARLLTGQTDTARVFVQPLASALVADSGNAQSATVDSLLAQPIVARVTASDGLGVRGIVVRFTTASGTLSVDSALTDSTGRARTTWRLGAVAGAQVVKATSPALSGDTTTFTATATAGTPTVVTAVAGAGQTATVGTAVSTAPSVLVKDAQGNPVPGVSVEFAVTQGGGSVTGGTTTTDATGTASVGSWTLGTTVGTNTLAARAIFTPLAPPATAPTTGTDSIATPPAASRLSASATDQKAQVSRLTPGKLSTGTVSASIPSPNASPTAGGTDTLSVTFTANAVTGAASTLVFSTQPPSAVTAVTAFGVAVQVRDAFGNVLTGDNTTSVTLAIASGTGISGALLGGTLTRTVSAGVATFSGLTIDSAGSGYQLQATSTGLTAATSNAFSVSTGVVATVTVSPTSRSLASLGDTAQFSAVARDAGGNLLSGATFTWSLSDSTVAGVTAAGIVTAVANGGTYVRATSGGVSDSALVTIAQVPAALTFTSQPTTAIPFTAEVGVVDARGNLATNDNSTSVTLALSGGTAGATLSGTTTQTVTAGLAAFTNLTINLVGTGYQLTANATGLTPAVSAAFNVLAPPTGNHWITGAGGNWSVAGNWSRGTVPAAGDTAYIDLAGTYTVTADGSPTVGALVVGGSSGTQTLALASGTLTVDSSATFAANTAFQMSGGTLALTGTATATEQGSFTWSGGTLSGSGGVFTTNVGATWTISGGAKTLAGPAIFNGGTAAWSGGTITVSGPTGAFTNSGTFDIQAPDTLSGTLAFINNGTVLRTTTAGTGAASLGVSLSNGSASVVDVRADTLHITQSATFVNGATLQGIGVFLGTTAGVNNGAVKPGADTLGTLTLASGYDQGATGRLTIDLKNTTVGTGYDRLVVGDSVSLTGTIVVDTLAGFSLPTAVDSYPVLTYATARRFGTLTNVTLPSIAGLTLDTLTTTGTTRDTLWIVVTNPLAGAPPGTDLVWEGTADTTWANPANWSFGTVPDATKNVWIKASAPNQPIVAANASTNNLILQTGATVLIDTTFGLAVSGNLDAGYSSIRGPGVLILGGAGATVSGKVPDVTVTGTYTLGDSLVVTGNLVVSGGLTLGGHRAAVVKNFSTSGTGTLTMTNAADSLVVDSTAAFAGGSTSGLLTAGTLVVSGTFAEGGGSSPTAFAASGTHVTILTGTAAQTVAFVDPGATASHFNGLTLSNTTGVNFSTPVVSGGLFVGTGHPLTATGRVTLTNGGLTAGTGSRLAIPWLQLPGTLNSDPTAFSTVDTVVFSGATQTIPDTIPLKTVYVTGTGVSFPTPGNGLLISLNGTLHVEGTGAVLTLNGRHVHVVADSLIVGAAGSPTGRLVMSNTNDSLVVDSAVVFEGASTAGGLSAGVLELGAEFIQQANGNPTGDNFAPSGTHLTRFHELVADFPQTISFQNPGASYFNDVLTDNGGAGEQLVTNAYIKGAFTANDDFKGGSYLLDVTGNLTSAGAMAAAHLILRAGFQYDSTVLASFYSVDTTEYAGTSQTVIGVPYTNLLVTGTATRTGSLSLGGFLNVGPSGQLTTTSAIDQFTVPGDILADGSGVTGPAKILATGTSANLRGTVPNLDIQSTRTLTGATSASGTVDLTTGALVMNGYSMQVTGAFNPGSSVAGPVAIRFGDPDAVSSVLHVGGGLSPNGTWGLSMHESLDSLIVDGNAALYSVMDGDTSFTAGAMVLNGQVDEDGLPGLSADTNGAATLILGNPALTTFYLAETDLPFPNLLLRGGTVRFGYSPTNMLGNLIVADTAVLDLASDSITVAGDFITQGSGRIMMLSSGDILAVLGNATFGGGDESGILTSGKLEFAGNFTQLSTNSATSFAADAPHQTRFVGSAPQTVSFATPGSSGSHFGDVTVRTAGTTVTLGSNVYTGGTFMVTDSTGGATPVAVGGPGPLHVAGNIYVLGGQSTGGSLFDPDSLYVGLALSSTRGVTISPAYIDFDGSTGAQVIPTGQFGNGTYTYTDVQVDNSSGVNFESSKQIGGSLTISSGKLIVDSATISVSKGDLDVTNSGVLAMNGGTLDVQNANFDGGDETGLMAGGTIIVRRNFTQTGTNSTASFAASGSNLVAFADTSGVQQTVSFANPDTAASHFARLQIAQGLQPYPGVSLLSDAVATDSFTVFVGNARQLMYGNGHALTVGGLNVNGLDLDHVLLTWTDVGPFSGAFSQFLVVHFLNYAATDTQFTVLRSGAVSSFIMSSLYFNTLPTDGVGYYVKAEDPVTGDLNTLAVDLGFFLASTQLPAGETCSTLPTHLDPVSPATILHSCS